MKYSGEHYYEWLAKVSEFELKLAMNQIDQKSTESILETLSNRLVEKFLHPLMLHIMENSIDKIDYDPERSLKEYSKYKTAKPAADHITKE